MDVNINESNKKNPHFTPVTISINSDNNSLNQSNNSEIISIQNLNPSPNKIVNKSGNVQKKHSSKNYKNCFQYKLIYIVMCVILLLINIIFIIMFINYKSKLKNKYLDENNSLHSKITKLNYQIYNLTNNNNRLINENKEIKIENKKYKNETEKLQKILATDQKIHGKDIDYKNINYNVSLASQIDYTNK